MYGFLLAEAAFYLAPAAFQRRGTPMSNSAAENPAVFSENRYLLAKQSRTVNAVALHVAE